MTAQDYEQLTLDFSRTIARVKCITPKPNQERGELGIVDLLVVPAVADSLGVGDLSRLHVRENFIEELLTYLDCYRLLTTHVRVKEPEYIGIQVKAQIAVDDFSNPDTVLSRVNQHLLNYLNPLVPFPEREEEDHLLEQGWIGWPFGKNLFTAEIFALIQRVPGVKYVLDVALYSRSVNPRSESLNLEEQPQAALVEDKVIWVDEEALLCSLDHQITVVELADVYKGQH